MFLVEPPKYGCRHYKLAKIDNIVGVKEASSDPDQITNIISDSPENFKVWSGNDNETFSIMSTGGYGVVSVASNIIGNQVKKLMGFILDGQTELAAKEHKRLLLFFNALFWYQPNSNKACLKDLDLRWVLLDCLWLKLQKILLINLILLWISMIWTFLNFQEI